MEVKHVSAAVFITSKLIYVRAEDFYHQIISSIEGLHVSIAEPASVDWIGSSLRRALQSADFTKRCPEQWDQAHADASVARAKQRFDDELQAIARIHKLRKDAVLSKAVLVWVFWRNGEAGNDLKLVATNHRRGGYLPLNAEPRSDKHVDLRLDGATNGVLGEAVRSMQAQSLLGGKPPETRPT